MNRDPIILTALLTLLLLRAPAYAEDRPGATIPQEDLEKIRKAAPAEAPATPKQSRRLLVFSRLTGFRHKSVPWGAQALRVIGEKSGAYTAVLSDDPAPTPCDANSGE